jgi:hypothetical protein
MARAELSLATALELAEELAEGIEGERVLAPEMHLRNDVEDRTDATQTRDP